MQVQREDGRNETFRIHAHFCMFILSSPFINMEDIVAEMSFVCTKKSKNGLYAWFSPSRLCLYLFCKDCRLNKGLNTRTDWAFSLTLSYGSSLNR